MPDKDDNDADLLDSLIGRAQERAADRLERQMQEADEIKSQEETASRDRLEEMWTREYDRQRAIAQQQAEQRRQEQMLLRYALIGAGIIIVIVIVLILVLTYA